MRYRTWKHVVGLGLVSSFLTSTVWAQSPSAECWVEGNDVSISQVTVRPLGKPPFQVAVSGLRVRALLPRKQSKDTALIIDDALTFQATTQTLVLPLKSAFSSADASVQLPVGTRLVSAYVEGKRVVASVVLEQSSDFDTTDTQQAATLSPVSVPCASLSLNDVAEEDSAPISVSPDVEWVEWKTSASSARLLRERNGKSALNVSHPHRVMLQKLSSDEEWMKVRLQQGALRVDGWVPVQDVEEVADVNRTLAPLPAISVTREGDALSSGQDEAVAVLQPLTKIFSTAGGTGQWATVNRPLEVLVRVAAETSMVQVLRIPGIVGLPPHGAWVEKEEVDILEASVP